jgi:hypothetical protein
MNVELLEKTLQELTDKTVKTPLDKLKVARTVAEILGYEKTEDTTNADQIVNYALRKYKTRVLTGEAINLMHRALKVAKDAGIAYDEKLVPKAAKEKESTDEIVSGIAEALSMAARRKRAATLRRLQPQIKRKKEIAKKKLASNDKLMVRAKKKAHDIILKKKLLKTRNPEDLSVSEKSKYETQMKKYEGVVKKLAKKLLPKVKKAEMARYQSQKKQK